MSPSEMSVAKEPSLITHALLVVTGVFPFLSLASILLRWRARRVSKQTFAADDWWIVISWVTTFAMSILVWVFAPMIGVDHIIGTPLAVSRQLQCLFLLSCIVQIPLCSVKISVLLLYRRIFNVSTFRTVTHGVIALVVCWATLFFLLLLFMFDPVDAAWGASPGYARFDPAKLGYAQVGTSISLDLLVLCLPVPLIYKLHLDWKRKLAVIFIFWLGSFCVIAAIVRFVILHRYLHLVLESTGFSVIYLASQNIIFMLIEPHCSIIAACLPCYGPLVRGGRSQMSLVNSVRSLFSLRSQGSDASNSRFGRFGSGSLQANAATESQIELKNSQGHSTTVVERQSQHSDIERGEVQPGGINVTNDVHVVRSYA